MKRWLSVSVKGGVGKSTLAVAIGRALAKRTKVGVVDLDVQSPKLSEVMGLGQHEIQVGVDRMYPVTVDGLKVFTLDFLPEREKACLWEGKLAADITTQLLDSIDWGDTEYLIIDCPPGTGEVTMTLLKQLRKDDCAIIVTGPRPPEVIDAVRTLDALEHYKTRVAGVIVNFAHVACPCGKVQQIGARPEDVAAKLDLPLLGVVPLCVGDQKPEDYVDAEKLLAATKRRFSLFGSTTS